MTAATSMAATITAVATAGARRRLNYATPEKSEVGFAETIPAEENVHDHVRTKPKQSVIEAEELIHDYA